MYYPFAVDVLACANVAAACVGGGQPPRNRPPSGRFSLPRAPDRGAAGPATPGQSVRLELSRAAVSRERLPRWTSGSARTAAAAARSHLGRPVPTTARAPLTGRPGRAIVRCLATDGPGS